jgi:putative CocE/NonD family hydrolase
VTKRLPILVVVVAALAGLLVAPGAHAADETIVSGAAWHEEYYAMSDMVQLHADVYLPPGEAHVPHPTIVLFTAEGGTYQNAVSAQPMDSGPYLDDAGLQADGHLVDHHGYALVIVDARGYGASGGCDGWFGNRAYDDTWQTIREIQRQPWSNGEIGVVGGSFSTSFGLMAIAAQKAGLLHGIDAVEEHVVNADWYQLEYTNHNRYPVADLTGAWYGALAEYLPPSPLADSRQITTHQATPATCPPPGAGMSTAPDDPTNAYWTERDWVARMGPTDVPALIAEGFRDGNVRTNAFLEFWNAFTGPRYGWFGFFDHEPATADDMHDARRAGQFPHIGHSGLFKESTAFFDTYVKGMDRDTSGLSEFPTVVVGEGHGAWRGEKGWPIEQSTLTIPVVPGSYVDAPVSSSETRGPVDQTADATVPEAMQGAGAWSITPPLDTDVHLTGSPRVALHVRHPLALGVTVVTTLFEIAADGTATPLSRSAADLGANDTEVSFPLYPVDWRFPAGSRIGLLVAGADLRWWFTPGRSGQTVSVVDGSLALPLETCPEGHSLDGGPSAAFQSLRPIHVAVAATREAPASIVRASSCGRDH